jgi:hypothetical protein
MNFGQIYRVVRKILGGIITVIFEKSVMLVTIGIFCPTEKNP